MPRVAVIVPWRGGCPHRERAWEWVARRYQTAHPTWQLVQAPHPADGPWCKAGAVSPALAASSADLVVVADADVWVPHLDVSVARVHAAGGWAIPHRLVHRLTPAATDLVLQGADPDGQATEQPPYRGVSGGGIIVAARATLLDVPPDPRFVGWGQEDVSWAVALHTLIGPVWRGALPLFHLWHPPQQRLSRKVGSIAGRQLHRRYLAARENPDAMRALLKEALCRSPIC